MEERNPSFGHSGWPRRRPGHPGRSRRRPGHPYFVVVEELIQAGFELEKDVSNTKLEKVVLFSVLKLNSTTFVQLSCGDEKERSH